MPRLLPAIIDRAGFYRVRHQPIGDWRPALQALATRHGFPVDPVERFRSGENPVSHAVPRNVRCGLVGRGRRTPPPSVKRRDPAIPPYSRLHRPG